MPEHPKEKQEVSQALARSLERIRVKDAWIKRDREPVTEWLAAWSV